MDKIYCINLDKRSDRWNTICVPQFSKHNLNVERVSAVDGMAVNLPNGFSSQFKGRIGCAMSHLKVLRLAKELNVPRVLILEDDVSFANEFTSTLSNLIVKVPDNWDMIFLGANHVIKPTFIGNGITKFNKAFTTHAYIVSLHILDELIELISTTLDKWIKEGNNTSNTAVDVLYSNLMSRRNVYGFQKTLVTQMPSVSDIEGHHVNYTGMIK